MDETTHPGTFLRDELDRRGWTQRELAEIVGRPFQLVNEIVLGKRGISPETAVALGAAFGTGPEIWIQRDAEFQATQTVVDTAAVRRRARMYDLAPIKEMERRQWIVPSDDADSLERELRRFFGVETLEKEPHIVAAMRRSSEDDEPLSPAQRAWCFRVLQLGSALMAAEYSEAELPKCVNALRKLAAYPQEAHKVPQTLARFGIRFVIVEPLSGAKVDGVALWRDAESPIIGMSIRYDRVDNFWFTLLHELSHIRHRDAPHLDSDMGGEQLLDVKSTIELRADEEAASALIPKQEVDSFIRRVGPLYSKDRIIQFAHRINMHPGIVVGQLQKRSEIGWGANREMLSKVRHFVVPVAVTDGWGHSVDPRIFSK